MNMVLTLVVKPNNSDLLNNCISACTEQLQKQLQVTSPETMFLSEGEAIDLHFPIEETTIDDLKPIIADQLKEFPVDWALQQVSGRQKKLLLADMDSTMITVECIDELADFANIKDKVAAITEAAMRGELDFQTALIERVALLKGLDTSVLEQCYDERIKITPGAETLLATMAHSGAYSALVSGGFTFFTNKVASKLGFSIDKANVLGIEAGKLTGTVLPPICDANTKEETLKRLQTEQALKQQDIIAVGDGANDIPMLKAAGLGVAYRAKPLAQAAADASINHTDLTTLLFFQGYSRSDFQ